MYDKTKIKNNNKQFKTKHSEDKNIVNNGWGGGESLIAQLNSYFRDFAFAFVSWVVVSWQISKLQIWKQRGGEGAYNNKTKHSSSQTKTYETKISGYQLAKLVTLYKTINYTFDMDFANF